MCGICGAFEVFDPEAKVRTMCDHMVHRGPDGEGLWMNGRIALGHRRLAIVDLSEKGRQPMVSSDGRLVASVNGEIYNYPDLRTQLEGRGAVFQSDCDSEIVLHAYEAWGSSAFSRLNGMFAFALWDSLAQSLFLVRDPLGIKPLYVHKVGDGVLFASELRALLAATGARRWSIDPRGLYQYLTFQNLVGSQTLFEGVSMVPPGHSLEIERGSVRSTRYWSATVAPAGRAGFEETVTTFREVFAAAVERHLMSDVPIASYLSAGFDSTMVACYAAQKLGVPPHAFTGRFVEGGWYDETAGARVVAERIGAQIDLVDIGPEDLERHFDAVVFALEEPRMGMGAFPQYLVARKAAETHKIILTGHGGDELFSGYPVFKLAQLAGQSVRRPSSLLRSAAMVKPSELPHLAYFGFQQLFGPKKYSFLPELFNDDMKSAALMQSAAQALKQFMDQASRSDATETTQDAYQRILLTYINVYLPGLLVVEDKISMAHSLESRTPYLDKAMVDFALAVSPSIKLNDGVLKAVVKQAGRGVLPDELYGMPKRGFPTPLRHWLRGPMRDWMRARICGPETTLTRIFRRSYLEQTAERYVISFARRVRPLDEIPTHRMWMLLCLESWIRQYEERLGIRLEIDGAAS